MAVWQGLNRFAVGVCALVAGVSTSGGAAAEDVPTRVEVIPLVNETGYFADSALQNHLRASLGRDTLDHLAAAHDAVWILAFNTSLRNGSNYCWAAVGLTEAAPKGRNARIPATYFSDAVRSNTRGALNDEQLNDCMSGALKAAVKRFVAEPLEGQLKDIEQTRGQGTRKFQQPDPTKARLFSSGISDGGKNRVFGEIPDDFRKAFDFRRLEWVVLADQALFGNQIVCFSIAGVAARPPDERTPRLPAYRRMVTRELTASESAEEDAGLKCREDIAPDSVRDLANESWDEQGVLDGFARTREDGVPLVTAHRRTDPKSLEAQKVAQFRRSLKIGSDSHCGLVVDVRGPIARVQSMIGEVWLKTAQLYPKGQKDCRFMNGVYQDPD
jgi:hypothetical protein